MTIPAIQKTRPQSFCDRTDFGKRNGISDGDFDAVGAHSCRLQALTHEMERIRATLDFKDSGLVRCRRPSRW